MSETKPLTKTELLQELATATGLSKKDVTAVIDAFPDVCKRQLNSAGSLSLPGLFKIVRVQKPATKARVGIDPFTKKERTYEAKPARNVVKVRPLKALKEMV